MKGSYALVIIILGIIAIIGAIIVYKILKPYVIKHDTTECFTGGLGTGKTFTATKEAKILYRKSRFFNYTIYNLKQRFFNLFRKLFKKPLKELREEPLLYTNYPVNFRKHILWGKRIWSHPITENQMLLLEPLREFSVVVIDELPQFINQFNWSEELIKKNVNEFITFFRHYIGGYLVVTAQSTADVVVQIRRKLNRAVWCTNFHAWPLPIKPFCWFYTMRMCDVILSDDVQTISTTYIEENTKIHFGIIPWTKEYDSRCYKERYKNIYLDEESKQFNNLLTNRILRLQQYISPLDDWTQPQQKEEMRKKAAQLCATQTKK